METLTELRDRMARAREAVTDKADVRDYDRGVADGLSIAGAYIDVAIARQLRDLAAEAVEVFGSVS